MSVEMRQIVDVVVDWLQAATPGVAQHVLKSVFFGGIIATMGCYYGLRTEGGAEAVGDSTTRAVVASCLLILIVDYLLASFLFRVLFA